MDVTVPRLLTYVLLNFVIIVALCNKIVKGIQRLFSVKYLFEEANIA